MLVATSSALVPAAMPLPKVAPIAASPEESPAALRPGMPSALTTATLPSEPATAPAADIRASRPRRALGFGKVVVLAQSAA